MIVLRAHTTYQQIPMLTDHILYTVCGNMARYTYNLFIKRNRCAIFNRYAFLVNNSLVIDQRLTEEADFCKYPACVNCQFNEPYIKFPSELRLVCMSDIDIEHDRSTDKWSSR